MSLIDKSANSAIEPLPAHGQPNVTKPKCSVSDFLVNMWVHTS